MTTLQDYREDKERIEFAAKVARDNEWDADFVRDHLVSAHQGQHLACMSCAMVALYFEVEVVIKPLDRPARQLTDAEMWDQGSDQ